MANHLENKLREIAEQESIGNPDGEQYRTQVILLDCFCDLLVFVALNVLEVGVGADLDQLPYLFFRSHLLQRLLRPPVSVGGKLHRCGLGELLFLGNSQNGNQEKEQTQYGAESDHAGNISESEVNGDVSDAADETGIRRF